MSAEEKKGISRRRFLQISALTAGATMLPMPVKWLGSQNAHAAATSQPLSKWGQGMRGLNVPAGHPFFGLIDNDPNGIPVMAGAPDPVFPNTRMYEVAANEFTDLLHPAMGGATRLWGYHEVGAAAPQRHLGGLVIAKRGEATRLRMKNNLNVPGPIIPIDVTIPGADTHNKIAIHLHGGEIPWISDGGPFDWWTPAGTNGLSFQNGPGSVLDNIPGNPILLGEADYFYPNDQSTRLMWYHDHAHGITRINAYAGLATGYLCVDLAEESIVSAKSLAAGVADNVPFIGTTVPVVFQDKVFVNGDPLLATGTFATDPTWKTVAPRSTATGSLWYEHIYNPKEFKLKKGGAFIPPPDPSAIPEFFGDTMLANGTVYPICTVQQKPTRFMFLNACNARFLNMNLYRVPLNNEIWTDPKTGLPGGYVPMVGAAAVPVPGPVPVGPALWQIGTEGGYLAAPASFPNGLPFNPATLTGNLLLGCAERADVVIDFTNVPVGTEFMMYNDAPGPFPAGPPTTDYYWGNPKNPLAGPPGFGPDTRQILRIVVGAPAAGTVADPPDAAMLDGITTAQDNWAILGITPPAAPGAVIAPPVGATLKQFTLNEDFDPYGRLRQMVGTTTPFIGKGGAVAFGLEYLVPPTAQDEHQPGAVEVWEIFNLTADTHPMHIHLATAQILSRQPFKIVNGIFTRTGAPRGPEANELGMKETFKMHPGEVITICMKWAMPPVPFTVPSSARALIGAGMMGMGYPPTDTRIFNEYVWHCHILEHEEHDMMRPLIVFGQNPQTPLSVNPAKASFNGALGGTTRFYIISGQAPYTVTSTGAVTVSPIATFNQMSYVDVAVSALTAGGPASITVTDAAGATTTAPIDIFGIAPYSTAVGGALGGTASFAIAGGAAPYSVVPSDPLYPAMLTATGFDVVVAADPLWVAGTVITVTYTVTDAAGNTATVTLAIN